MYLNGQGIYGATGLGWVETDPPLTCFLGFFFLELLLVSSLSLLFYLIAFPWARGALAPIKNDFTQTRFIIFFMHIFMLFLNNGNSVSIEKVHVYK